MKESAYDACSGLTDMAGWNTQQRMDIILFWGNYSRTDGKATGPAV